MRAFEAKLAITMKTLRQLGGCVDGIARLAGTSRRGMSGRLGFDAACARALELHGRPEGPVLVDAVREGRRTVGHRIAGDADALRIAAAVVDRKPPAVLVRGAFAPKVARWSGLRRMIDRPWAKDPEHAASLHAAADRLIRFWAPRTYLGSPGDPFHSALCMPAMSKDGSFAMNALVVLDPYARSFSSISYPAFHGRPDAEDPVEAKRLDLVDALEAGSWTPRAELRWLKVTADNAFFQATQSDLVFDYGARQRLNRSYERCVAGALAAFRNSLAPEIKQHAGMIPGSFFDPETIRIFLENRRGWTPQDYLRTNQALRLMPILNLRIKEPELHEPIRAGERLPVAAAKIFRVDRPLHAKTVQSLRGSWRVAPQSATWLVKSLDALYRGNPHLRVLSAKEVDCAEGLLPGYTTDVKSLARILEAHFDDAGRLRPAPHDISGVFNWIREQVSTLLDEPHHLVAVRAAHDILYPPERRYRSLVETSEHWHRNIRNYVDRRQNAILLARSASGLTEERLSVHLYPHFLEEPETVGGVTITPLACTASIVAEGHEMSHCVGGYHGQASAGSFFLLSLTSPDGRTTAQIRHDGQGRITTANGQHYAYGNSEAPRSHVAALGKLVARYGDDPIPGLRDRVAVAAAAYEGITRNTLSGCTVEQIAVVKDVLFGMISQYLIGSRKRMTRAEWEASVDKPGKAASPAADRHEAMPLPENWW